MWSDKLAVQVYVSAKVDDNPVTMGNNGWNSSYAFEIYYLGLSQKLRLLPVLFVSQERLPLPPFGRRVTPEETEVEFLNSESLTWKNTRKETFQTSGQLYVFRIRPYFRGYIYSSFTVSLDLLCNGMCWQLVGKRSTAAVMTNYLAEVRQAGS